MVLPSTQSDMSDMVSSENIRPWGRYDVLDEGDGFKVKRITVEPMKRLSYQSHKQRAEYWTLVSGQARVTLNDVPSDKTKGDTVFVPIGVKHRIENIGTEPVIFIEVQFGTYLEEDDITRYSDDYGRD